MSVSTVSTDKAAVSFESKAVSLVNSVATTLYKGDERSSSN